MNSTAKKFVHDLIAEGLNLPKSKVIWYYPNAPRPAKPYATLECFAEVGEAQEDIVKTATTGVYNFVVPVSATLRVQLYGNQGDDVCEQLNVLARRMETDTFSDKCFANKVAFYNAESVQDLSEVMEQSVDVRASIDFFVRTTSEILDDL
ncbi:MAG: hypothetical protein IKE94_06720, partial [Aeriscardovia sp.]|nr:hypothetical protein [Aeriscardovia sp.]